MISISHNDTGLIVVKATEATEQHYTPQDFARLLATVLTNTEIDELVRLRTGEPRLPGGYSAQ